MSSSMLFSDKDFIYMPGDPEGAVFNSICDYAEKMDVQKLLKCKRECDERPRTLPTVVPAASQRSASAGSLCLLGLSSRPVQFRSLAGALCEVEARI